MPEIEQFLYRVQPTRPEMLVEGSTPEEAAAVGEHFAYLKELTERGVVILAGRTLNADASSFGIVIFRAASEAEARAVMDNDPAIRQGVMGGDLFPYRVALMGMEGLVLGSVQRLLVELFDGSAPGDPAWILNSGDGGLLAELERGRPGKPRRVWSRGGRPSPLT